MLAVPVLKPQLALASRDFPAGKWQQSLPCAGSSRGQRGTGQSAGGQRAVALAYPDFFVREQVLTVTFFSAASRHTW